MANLQELGKTNETTGTGNQTWTPTGDIYKKGTVYSWTLSTDSDVVAEGETANLNDTYNGDVKIYQYNSSTSSENVSIGQLPYAPWNFWTGGLFWNEGTGQSGNSDRTYKNYVYGGLMEKELDREKNPQFTVPDAGIFTEEEFNGKHVYTNVKFPFKYTTDGYYEFDAQKQSAYFKDGQADSGKQLEYADTPQYINNSGTIQTGFAPFNTPDNSASNTNYHFGMKAEIPFNMTEDGTWLGKPIQFEFAGDDDMWVFVDGTLVLDLGGIHDSANGIINFKDGTVTRSATDGGKFGTFAKENENAGDADGTTNTLSDPLYNTESGDGLLGETKDTFASKTTHTLTIFYLERGKGTSNCKIKFNLPQPDSLTVIKDIPETDSAGEDIPAETMTALNNLEFIFTLKQNGTSMPNKLYLKISKSKIDIARTNSSGQFTLKNGEQAKFLTMDYSSENTYTVEETQDSRFGTVSWTRTVNPTDITISGTDNTFTVTGQKEIAEQVTLTAQNVYTHIDETTITPTPDTIVLDFGLPVMIDVLANDVPGGPSGTSKELASVDGTGATEYGTAQVVDNQIKFTLTKPLDQVITLTYTAEAVSQYGKDEKTSTVTIIPATQMYYEQDFENLVAYSVGEWRHENTPTTAYQEGLKGTSPYGTDTYYANNSTDSAGSYAKVDTSSGAAAFQYEFTGTGTAILAKLTPNTGYIFIQVKKAGEMVDWRYRDTRVMTTAAGKDASSISGATLYNIPVYQITGLDYGTYTVEVRIAKNVNNTTFGTEFYLDGIRVYDPLNPEDSSYNMATSEYQSDHESENKVVSLRDKLIVDYMDTSNNTPVWNTEFKNTNQNFVTLTDTDGNLLTAADYVGIGPKEELYLNAGQSVTFSLKNWDNNTGKIYLGMKTLTGAGSVSIKSKSIQLNNTIDQYYDISDGYALENGVYTFTIRVTNGPVSLTNIKVTGDADFAITENPEVSFG